MTSIRSRIGSSSGGDILSGNASLYYGGANMDNIPDLIFTGEETEDFFGLSVSLVNDLNNDGFSDLIIGAKWNDAGGYDAGRTYLFYGGVNFNNIADVTLTGETSSDNFGYSVSSAGDVNNDGYDDLIVGSFSDEPGTLKVDSVYIYFGGFETDAIPDVTFAGEANSDGFGVSVSSAGDVNSDGFSDVIIGALTNSSVGLLRGRAYIYLGGINMDNIPDVILNGEENYDFFGNNVSGAGDVGGPDAGAAYIFFGGINMDNIPDIILTGEAESDYFGNCVSSAGDVNNDGFSDVIVGVYLNDAGGNYAGRAYLYYGGINMDKIADIIFTGESEGIEFGNSVSTAGDVNNDGFSDIIIGAYLGGDGKGSSYIYFGGQNMNNISDINLTGETIFDRFGCSVPSAGDVNNDGFSDILIGAPGSYASGYQMGKTYLYSGSNIVGVEGEKNKTPEDYLLLQNYPNPFNPTTIIKYSLADAVGVSLVVYDILGREVKILVDEKKKQEITRLHLMQAICQAVFTFTE